MAKLPRKRAKKRAPATRRGPQRRQKRFTTDGEDDAQDDAGEEREVEGDRPAPHDDVARQPAEPGAGCGEQGRGTTGDRRAARNGQAGRRGRRRGAYAGRRAAADGGTRLGGAESKRRRRPRLPAPPSRVTLLARSAFDVPSRQ